MSAINHSQSKCRRSRRRTLLIGGILITLGIVAACLALPGQWWWKTKTEIKTGASLNHESAAYRAGDRVLIVIDDSAETSAYVINTRERSVGIANLGAFHFFPMFAYSSQLDPPLIKLDGTSPKVDRFDAKLQVTNHAITFKSLDSRDVTLML